MPSPRHPASLGLPTADQLVAEAQQRAALGDALSRLEALWLLDAARWQNWPQAAPGAQALEAALLAAEPPREDSEPARLLRSDLAARDAARQGSWAEAQAAINALGPGYSVKVVWSRWRELLDREPRPELWDRLRQGLSRAVGEHGVPPSETLPALLGQLDLPRWRAQSRLLRAARELLVPLLSSPPASGLDDATHRAYLAGTGRWLVAIGEEASGARLLHEGTEGLPTTANPRAGRLFSRPSPDAALWLRGAVDRAQIVDGEPRETLLLPALLALIHLALRHRAGHLLAETLNAGPVRFERADATALVLCSGASAWLTSGHSEQARDWYLSGLRLALRNGRSPLTGEAGLAGLACCERAGWRPDALVDLVGRLAGDARLMLNIEMARLRGRTEQREPAVLALGSLYRLAKSRYHEGAARPAMAVAGALRELGQRSPARALWAAALSGDSAALPTVMPSGAASEPWADQLDQAVNRALRHTHLVAPALWSLTRYGEADLARILLQRAIEGGLPEDRWPRFQAALALAQAIGDGADPNLPASVEAAVTAESSRVLERLRVDDPPA